MKEFEHAKEKYESTPIPTELNDRVQAGIRQGRANRARRAWGRRFGTVAACFVAVVGVLNLSPTVAAAAADVPVLGGLFQVLTVRSFTDENDDRTVIVEQPGLTGSNFAEKIDAEIQARVDEKIAEGEAMVAEYKEAFLDTGGTEAEWAERDYTVSVTYDIKSRTDTTVSFVVDTYIATSTAQQEQFFYNLDLAADKELTLRDLLGEDWVDICNSAIQAQIDASVEEDGFTYFFPPQWGGFTTVDEDTSFYIRDDGVPVVVYPKYSIAAGALGVVEFAISE